MHRHLLLSLVAGLALATTGCIYEVPFVEEAKLKIDPTLLGAWKEQVDEGDKAHTMVVLRFSDTEYLIHYPASEEGIYYRGYPIKIGEGTYIQLEVTGTSEGPPKDLDSPYTLARVDHKEDRFTIRMIDSSVVDDEIKTSEELRKAFLANIDHEELFGDPGTFLRVSPRE